jgi:hypothetical protein
MIHLKYYFYYDNKVTAKLYKQKLERDVKAKEEYVEINPYTFKAYYEKKSDILEH